MWKNFKKKGCFVREINHTIFTLIPKKSDCDSMSDYRPISLCNILYKIIAKALATRLKKLLPKLISENQNGFTPGREIADSIILVVEVIHSLHKDKLSGMLLRLDVSKAYDRVVWDFLLHVLKRFGFPQKWLDCIKFCMSTMNFSISLLMET